MKSPSSFACIIILHSAYLIIVEASNSTSSGTDIWDKFGLYAFVPGIIAGIALISVFVALALHGKCCCQRRKTDDVEKQASNKQKAQKATKTSKGPAYKKNPAEKPAQKNKKDGKAKPAQKDKKEQKGPKDKKDRKEQKNKTKPTNKQKVAPQKDTMQKDTGKRTDKIKSNDVKKVNPPGTKLARDSLAQKKSRAMSKLTALTSLKNAKTKKGIASVA